MQGKGKPRLLRPFPKGKGGRTAQAIGHSKATCHQESIRHQKGHLRATEKRKQLSFLKHILLAAFVCHRLMDQENEHVRCSSRTTG